MTKIKTLIVIGFFSATFFFNLSSVQADIYKCTNIEGLTVFKDSPCGSADKLKKIIRPDDVYDKELDYEIAIDNKGPLGKNLLLNSSFEKKLLDWRVPLGAFWSKNAGMNQSGGLVIQAEKPLEDKYLHRTEVKQCVLLNEGEKFGLSAKFRHTKIPKNAHANRANVVWYESTDCTTGGQYGSYIEPKQHISGWQKINHNNLTPALGAKAAQITIFQSGRYSNGGQGIWDNIIFAATEVHNRSVLASDEKALTDKYTLEKGKNYLLNGSFDKSIESWRADKETAWSGIQGERHPGSAKLIATSKSGSIGYGAFTQCVNIGNNNNFVLGGSFRRDENSSQKGSARLSLAWFGGKNCTGRLKAGQKHSDPKDIPGWQKLTIVGLRPLYNAQSARIGVSKSVGGKGKFTAYWDDIYFIAVD